MSRFDGIDIMKLYTKGNAKMWNDMLDDCAAKLDINKLAQIKRELQIGMTNLDKLKLNTEEINIQFIRWQRSIEITAKRIIKKKHPMPGDTFIASVNQNDDATFKLKSLNAKRKRDDELREFLRKSSY